MNERLATNINFTTIIAVYFLILVGGIVRSMGAGMGCPDWPKCFGQYIPPTDDSELPEGYEQAYVDARLSKNERLANLLEAIGMKQLAQKVASDPSIQIETAYDTQKAWVEYINRLIGVLIGFLIILNLIGAFSFRKKKAKVFWVALASLILVLFQGWVGSLVVSTNLLPGFISFHMLLALLLVCLLIYQNFLMKDHRPGVTGKWLNLLILGLFGIQIFMGIQVREEVDIIRHVVEADKSEWLAQLSAVFYVHRSYSILLVLFIGYWFYKNYQKGVQSYALYALSGIVLLEILLGAIMAYFDFPAFAQPSHLLLATVAFGLLFYLFLCSKSQSRIST